MKITDIVDEIKKREKVYCRYTVIDLHTGYALVYGEKWKTSADMYFNYKYDGSFRNGLRFRKIDEYHREIIIKGRECLIVYWAGAPVRKTGSVVTAAGCLAGLNGEIYDNAGAVSRFRALLWSIGYRRPKEKVGKKQYENPEEK